MGRFAVVITGASGSVYGMRFIEQLVSRGHEVAVMLTRAGESVTAHELGFSLSANDPTGSLASFLELPSEATLRVVETGDLFDPMASGSHRLDAMIAAPASMGFCASVAAGLASDLPERVADVMLKERRPLLLVPRETPLSLIHLRNLTALTEAGAIVLPAMPAFYHRPQTLDDAVSFVVGKGLDTLGVPHDLFRPWGSEGGGARVAE